MVAKKSMTKVGQKTELKSFYNSNKFRMGGEYEFGNVEYFMLLAPDSSYEINYHPVKFKKKEGVGFKSKSGFDTLIKCKSHDTDGTFLEQASCCVYGNTEGIKELCSWKRQKAFLPILVFGTTEITPEVQVSNSSKKEPFKPTILPVQKISLKTYGFKYIELALNSVEAKILEPFEKFLKAEGLISQDLEGEELREAIIEHLKTTIIKVEGINDKKINYPIQQYTFITFEKAKKVVDEDNNIVIEIDEETGLAVTVPEKSIASHSKEYEAIINYKNNISLQNDITDFIEDFEANIDSVFTDWDEAELKKYLIDDVESAENLDAFREGEKLAESMYTEPPKKVQQQVVKKALPTAKVIEVAKVEDTSLVVEDFDEEDMSFDIDEEEFQD